MDDKPNLLSRLSAFALSYRMNLLLSALWALCGLAKFIQYAYTDEPTTTQLITALLFCAAAVCFLAAYLQGRKQANSKKK